MPIYEYQCQACGDEVEVLQKISDERLSVCTACGKPSLQKKISAAGFRLKGGGWYETDFKTGAKKNIAGGDSASTGASAASAASPAKTAPSASSSDS